MTDDVGELLHQDAAAWRSRESGPPSLDDALDGVLRGPAKPGQRLRSWVAVAASVLVIAALAIGFGAWRAHRSAQEPAGPSGRYPSTIQYRGETLYANPGRYIDAVVVDRSRPRTVSILINFPDTDGKGVCLDVHPVAQVLSQSATTLRLDLITYKRVPPAQLPKTYYCGFTSFSAGPPATLVPVELARPLAARAVIRDARGAPVATIDPDAEAPTPAPLPSGYAAGSPTRADPARGRYAASRPYQHGANTLVIRAGYLPDDEPVPHGAHPIIGGNRADLSHAAGTSCVYWTNRAGLQLQVCAGGAKATRLTDAQVVEVARSLR